MKKVHMVVQYFTSNLYLICSLSMMLFSTSGGLFQKGILYEENFTSAIILEIDLTKERREI